MKRTTFFTVAALFCWMLGHATTADGVEVSFDKSEIQQKMDQVEEYYKELFDRADQPKDPKALFKEAMFQQTVEGNLERAARYYEKVFDHSDGSPGFSITVLFQLGACREKQGDKQKAAEAYRIIVEKYPTETKSVAKANEKLDKLVSPKYKQLQKLINRLEPKRSQMDSEQVKRLYAIVQEIEPKRYSWSDKQLEKPIQFLETLDKALKPPKGKYYEAYSKDFPVDWLNIHDKKVTRKYIKEKFGPPQYVHPRGLFLNYGVKYGLRFDMDGDRVREICLFQSFPGKVVMIDTQKEQMRFVPLQEDFVSDQIRLVGKKPPIQGTIVDRAGNPIPDVSIETQCIIEVDKGTICVMSLTPQQTDRKGNFVLRKPKATDRMVVVAKQEHYATKLVRLCEPGHEKESEKTTNLLPSTDEFRYADNKLAIVLDKGAGLRGKFVVLSSNGEKIPISGYQVSLIAKGSSAGAKSTVEARNGKFSFDGILETQKKGDKDVPITWELSFKSPNESNKKWIIKEITFRKGEQAEIELVRSDRNEPGQLRSFKLVKIPPKSEPQPDEK